MGWFSKIGGFIKKTIGALKDKAIKTLGEKGKTIVVDLVKGIPGVGNLLAPLAGDAYDWGVRKLDKIGDQGINKLHNYAQKKAEILGQRLIPSQNRAKPISRAITNPQVRDLMAQLNQIEGIDYLQKM